MYVPPFLCTTTCIITYVYYNVLYIYIYVCIYISFTYFWRPNLQIVHGSACAFEMADHLSARPTLSVAIGKTQLETSRSQTVTSVMNKNHGSLSSSMFFVTTEVSDGIDRDLRTTVVQQFWPGQLLLFFFMPLTSHVTLPTATAVGHCCHSKQHSFTTPLWGQCSAQFMRIFAKKKEGNAGPLENTRVKWLRTIAQVDARWTGTMWFPPCLHHFFGSHKAGCQRKPLREFGDHQLGSNQAVGPSIAELNNLAMNILARLRSPLRRLWQWANIIHTPILAWPWVEFQICPHFCTQLQKVQCKAFFRRCVLCCMSYFPSYILVYHFFFQVMSRL